MDLADESGYLQEADLEEIAGHRFEKTKGGAVSKINYNKRSMIKIGREDVEMVGKMDELKGEEWEERAR